jgi:hypothetical protein
MNKCIGFLLISGICLSCQPAQESNSIVFKNSIDLGSVTVGKVVKFSIDVLNPTDQLIKIVSVKGDCGCLTVNRCPTGLEPNQNGTISATYSSRFEKKSAGIVHRNVIIQLNRKPFLHLVKLKVNVE